MITTLPATASSGYILGHRRALARVVVSGMRPGPATADPVLPGKPASQVCPAEKPCGAEPVRQ